jgi:transposase
MSARFVNVDRETPLLFPEDLRGWPPEDHPVHFIIEAIGSLGLRGFKVNTRGSGREQYPPEMMVILLLYCYATGRMSSREIGEATYTDVAVRYICGNTAHPDHTVICRFRTENKEVFKKLFTELPVMAQGMGYLKELGNIGVDGTKIHGNASKHGAVSYKRAVEMIEEAEKEVEELIVKAEEADSRPLEAGLRIPEEIKLREDRKAALEEAKGEMEKRYEEAEREAEEGAKGSGGGKKQGGTKKPLEKYRYNITDPESRSMKAGNGKHFERSYNGQAAVDTETMLEVGE